MTAFVTCRKSTATLSTDFLLHKRKRGNSFSSHTTESFRNILLRPSGKYDTNFNPVNCK